MLRPLHSTPPSIAIAEEPLEDAGSSAAGSVVSVEGFEVVPAWRARSPYRRRLLAAAGPVVAAGLAFALLVDRGHDDQALRRRPATGGSAVLVQPLVVSAHYGRASVSKGP